MVHKKYLDQAVRIRRDFLNTDVKLVSLKEDLERINNNIQRVLERLIEIKENSSNYSSDEEYQKDVMENLKDLELQAKSVDNIYKPINEYMESLKKEESDLYDTLIKEYPNLGREEIVKQVQAYVSAKVK